MSAAPVPTTTDERSFILGQWTRLLFATLVQCGVRDAFISPGSRNGPLILGALRARGFTCHSVFDERTAGFLALGLARATGRVPLLIATSGSAGAHYLPALIEAYHSEHGLLVLTADRPSELMDCGAPQTVHQEGMFGSFAQRGPALGEPSADLDKVRALRRKVAQSVHQCRGPRPGPVHLNFPVQKPLQPHFRSEAEPDPLRSEVDRLLSLPAALPDAVHARTSVESASVFAQELFADGKAVLISVGPASSCVTAAARALARTWGVPCWSELPSKGGAAPVEFAAERLVKDPHTPRVLHVGGPSVSASLNSFFKQPTTELYLATGSDLRDPSGNARRVLLGNLELTLQQLSQTIPPASALRAAFLAADHARQSGLVTCVHAALISGAARIAHAELTEEARLTREALLAFGTSPAAPHGRLDEPNAVLQVLSGTPSETHVLVGNSLPIRLTSWVSSVLDRGFAEVFTARGANGIDGWIAAAVGSALGTGKPTLALVGDVTFAHDLSSLLQARLVRVPLVIVILDNGGGRIFDHLPARAHLSNAEARFFTTPTNVDFQAAAQTYGVRFRACSLVSQVAATVAEGLQHSGTTIIHLPTDPETTHVFLDHVRSSVSQL